MTVSKLATALGVSRQLISVHRKKADAPALDDLAGWTVFLAAHGRAGSVPAELRKAIAEERLKILKETTAKMNRENQIEDGKLILVTEVIRQAGCAGGYFMAALETICRELPPMLAGHPTEKIAVILETHVERIRKHMTEKLNAMGKVSIKPQPRITLSGVNTDT